MALMRSSLVAVLLVLLALPGPAAAQSSAAAAPSIIRATLPSGLRVVLSPLPTTTSIVVALSYPAGSAHDPAAKRGTARLLESMMFAGSKSVRDGQHVEMVNAVGGSVRVLRSPEMITFSNLVPARQAAVPLWLEADRMLSLALPSTSLRRERAKLVARTRAEVLAASPISAPLAALALQGHAGYGRSALADLEHIDADDLRRFHASRYRIDRAVVSVVGHFNPPAMMRAVRRYFGRIQARTDVPAALVAKPATISEQNSPRSSTLRAAWAQRGALALGWALPARKHKDLPALELAGELLAGGSASRLYNALVRNGKALSVRAAFGSWRHAGVLQIVVGLARGGNASKTAVVVERELRRLQTKGPSASGLLGAKRRLCLRWLAALQDDGRRAHLLARHELLDGNATTMQSRLDAYSSVSVQQLREVAVRYLASHRRSTIELSAAPIVVRKDDKKKKRPRPKRGTKK